MNYGNNKWFDAHTMATDKLAELSRGDSALPIGDESVSVGIDLARGDDTNAIAIKLAKAASRVQMANKSMIALAEAVSKQELKSEQKDFLMSLRRGGKSRLNNVMFKYIAETENKSPYCNPQWVNGYLGWCASRFQHPESNCYVGVYMKDLKELTDSTRLEF